MARPSVSVVVPFHGDADQARRTLAAVARLALGQQDEVIVADNTVGGLVGGLPEASPFTVVHATAEQSPSHARNAGAARARGEWLLFVDADCVVPPDLLERYLAAPVDAGTGALAGEVEAAPAHNLISRYAALREHLSQRAHVEDAYRPRAVTANLLVRRAAWEAVGGFVEGVRAAEDADFCFRMQDAGHALAYAGPAGVLHEHRETLRALLAQRRGYAAGAAWLERRHPGAAGRPRPARMLLRFAPSVLAFLLTGRLERAAYKGIDLLALAADTGGRLASNRSRPAPSAPAAARELRLVAGDALPAAAEHVEAGRRPLVLGPQGGRVAWREDDGAIERLRALGWLALRRPGAVRADRRDRRPGDVPLRELAPVAMRLRPARGAVLVPDGGLARDGERLSRLLGRPCAAPRAGA